MSDAPERVYWNATRGGFAWHKTLDGHTYHEHLRADLARLPDDLVAEIRAAMPLMRDRASAVMYKVLAWHEQGEQE